MIVRRGALLLCSLAFAACFGSSAELTDAGNGIPQVSVEFPDKAEPGSVQRATLTVMNPGPGDMPVMDVTFVRVGTERPLVELLAGRANDSIVSVSPEPLTFDGILYRFEGPAEGETEKVTFEVRIPNTTGVVANSVTVADPQDPQRARGDRLATTVRR